MQAVAVTCSVMLDAARFMKRQGLNACDISMVDGPGRCTAHLKDIWVHWTDRSLLHWVLVLAVKVVKKVDIVQRILTLHGKVNAVLTEDDI